jgi:hypothetical protein
MNTNTALHLVSNPSKEVSGRICACGAQESVETPFVQGTKQCKECRSKDQARRYQEKKDAGFPHDGPRTCVHCSEIESEQLEFDKAQSICVPCRRKQKNDYRNRGGVKASKARTRINNPISWMLMQSKRNATKRGIPWDLTREDIFIPEYCPILGIKLEPYGSKNRMNRASLDRLIPALGYIRGNVNISSRANLLKSNMTLKEIETLAAWMRSKIGD